MQNERYRHSKMKRFSGTEIKWFKDTRIQGYTDRDSATLRFWSKDPVIERKYRERRLQEGYKLQRFRDSDSNIYKILHRKCWIVIFAHCFSNIRCRCWTLVWSIQGEQTLTTSGRSDLRSTEDPDQTASSDHTSPGAEQEQQINTWTRETHMITALYKSWCYCCDWPNSLLYTLTCLWAPRLHLR